MQIFGLTDIGQKRETNEDNFGILGFTNASNGAAVVADGMGGHKAGEIASKEAVKLILTDLSPCIGKKMTPQNIGVLMVSAIKNANAAIRRMASQTAEQDGMGTTVTVAFVTDDTAYIANVGDSRAYIINDKITQITRDHSLVEGLIDKGEITRSDAKTHPRKHVITRAVGVDESILVDIFEYKYQNGADTLLLCSDGLTEMVDDDEILNIIKSETDIKTACEALVNRANELGGIDNITVVGGKL